MQRERSRTVPSPTTRRGVAAGLIALALLVGACAGDGGEPMVQLGAEETRSRLTVSAASSLTNAFEEIIEAFTKSYNAENIGTVSVDLNTGSSSSLADAIISGAPAGVFASADHPNMTKLQDAGLVYGSPTTFAHNKLVIVTKPGNPVGIKSTADLPAAGVISLCAIEAPCGKYAAQALVSAKVTVDESNITRGQNVAATLDQVTEGDAVAAIVYVSDALAKADQVDTVVIPDTQNVIAAYPIAALGKKANPASTAFIAFVVGKTGQRILKKYGFLP